MFPRHFVSALVLLVVLSSGATDRAAQGPAAAEPRPAAKLRVLFIGNSFTHMNDLVQLTARLAASGHPPRALETHEVGEGGATLKRHWETGKALAAIRTGKWDYVVLQEQGSLGSAPAINGTAQINDPKMFYEYARLFDAEIKKAAAKTVFFLTWAQQDAPQSQALLTNAYAAISGELKAVVAPVGVAWQNALQQNPKLVLHYSDGSHPNAAGSYLAACVFYAVFYGSTPEGLNKGDLNDADANFLQRIAWRTAQATQMGRAVEKVPVTEATTAEAKPATEPATPAALERGRAILEAAQAAAGGVERLRAIKDVSVVTSGKIVGPEGQIPVETRDTLVFPSVLRSEQQFPFGVVAGYFDGSDGWRKTPRGVQDPLPDSMKPFFRGQIIRNTIGLLRAEGQFTVHFEKREKLGDAVADVILISKQGENIRLFVDVANGALLKKAFRGVGTGGPVDMEEIYSDYREVSGIRFPFRIVVNQNGAPLLEASVTDLRFNSGVDTAKLATKPQ